MPASRLGEPHAALCLGVLSSAGALDAAMSLWLQEAVGEIQATSYDNSEHDRLKWGNPPAFAWVPALRQCKGHPRTTHAGQVWRHMAERLEVGLYLISCGKWRDFKSLAARLARYVPDTRRMAKPAGWHWWRAFVKGLHVHPVAYIDYARTVLDEWATVEEIHSAARRYQRWCDWACSSSKGSAALAHKFLKGPSPWQPFEVFREGLEAWGSPQNHMEAREAFWHPIWKVDDAYPKLEIPSASLDMVAAIPMPSYEQFGRLARSYRASTAVGGRRRPP